MSKPVLSVAAIAISAALSVSSQARELEGVTVTGAPIESAAVQNIDSYGNTYNQVTRETIESQASRDFNATLRSVPSVITASQTMMGGQTSASLYIRGRGASHPSPDLQVQFDGVPRMGALYGQTLGDGIAVETMGGMDVYKSPAPVVFGSGYAMVNVQPRKMEKEGWMAEIGAAGGSYKSFDQHAVAGYKSGPFDIFAAQSFATTDGHRSNSAAHQSSYYVNLGYAFHENWEARLIANHARAKTESPVPTDPAMTQGAERYDTETTFTTLSLNNRYEKANGFVKAYWNDTKFYPHHENPGTGDLANSKQSVRLFGLRARETFNLWKGGELMAGFDLDEQHLDNSQNKLLYSQYRHWDFPHITVFSPYIGINQMLGDEAGWHMKPSAGLRYYHNNEFGNKLAPQASLSVGYGATDLSLSYARGVNYPSPVILQGAVLKGSELEWGDIKAEVVDHFELGLSHSWGERATVSANVFYDKGKDRFRAYMGGPAFWALENFNDPIGRYKTKGVELSATVRPLDTLEVYGAVTWMDSKARGADGVELKNLPFTPDVMVKAGVDWKFLPRTSLHADVQYMHNLYEGTSMRGGNPISGAAYSFGEQKKLKDITLVNLKLTHRFDWERFNMKDSQAFVAVYNLFDHKYAWRYGYPQPGITFMAGLNLRFE